MSNYLAIATVTATIQRVLQDAVGADVPGIFVTTEHPGASGEGIPKKRINLFLYQAIPNPAWRNNDLRSRRPKGELIKQAQAGLDLFYILSFYGEHKKLEPQRLLGSAVRSIVDNPILTSEMILETMHKPDNNFLLDSTLEQQVEKVTVVPTVMTKEELSKIWSSYFQPPYVLSFAIQAGAVLIEGNKPSGRALPVRRIATYSTPNQLVISQVVSADGFNQPIVSNSMLIIRGQHLNSEHLQIKIGKTKLRPQKVESDEIKLDLSLLSNEERHSLRAGVQSLQALRPVPQKIKQEPEQMIGSNVVSFVLCPNVIGIEVAEIEENLDELYRAKVRVELDLTVGKEQKVFLFFNERSASKEAAYIFTADSQSVDSNVVMFTVNDVKKGEYLVRVQIDGAESPLEVDTQLESETFEQYVRPVVVIGKPN
ncbi:hypothetical protein A6770_22025 [Nostoc minutum NIES-26]|uniref:Pvc16 N-terminal domain-containing protein n=1 Tax=Nostoc minutum NIES-26 TaxID=1844469 RepID=A0A367R1E5_9NOSO|nr:hypothetical protein A6770_22025 [Nostoc minutum NIES-26]